MKSINIIKVSAILLMLAGGGNSCGKRAESGNEVPYKPCPCENGDEPLVSIKGNTRLFIIPLMEEEGIFQLQTVESMCFYHDSLSVIRQKSDNPNFPSGLFSLNGGAVFNICNFPDFAKQWHAPEGIVVFYEGTVYPYCAYPRSRCANVCYNLVLTKLKKIE